MREREREREIPADASPKKHFCMDVLWEREREIPADTSPKKQFIRVSIQFVTLQYVREGRALLQVIKQTAEHLAGGLVLHKEDFAMLINGITNTLNATWSFWLRPAHVYSQEVLERRELRYEKKSSHTHDRSMNPFYRRRSRWLFFFVFFRTSAILVSPSL
jgi:hypothetical protein